MPIENGILPLGAVYTPSGGSILDMISLGRTSDSHKILLDEGLDLILRKTLLVTSKAPVPNASSPNGYTQQRTSLVFHLPKLLANGNYTKNSLRIEFSYDPETTSSERAFAREMISHVGLQDEFNELFSSGSPS